jgi:hypothetical protein
VSGQSQHRERKGETTMEAFVKLVAEGSMRALILIAESKGIKITGDDAQETCDALKKVMNAELDEMLKELKAAVEAHMGEAMYRQIVNVWANSIGLNVLKEMGRL